MYSLPLFLVYWLIVYFLASKPKGGRYGEDEGYGRGRPFLGFSKVHSREEKDAIAVACMLFFILSDFFFEKQLLALFVLSLKYMMLAWSCSMVIFLALVAYTVYMLWIPCILSIPFILFVVVGIPYLILFALPAAIAEKMGEAIAKRCEEPV